MMIRANNLRDKKWIPFSSFWRRLSSILTGSEPCNKLMKSSSSRLDLLGHFFFPVPVADDKLSWSKSNPDPYTTSPLSPILPGKKKKNPSKETLIQGGGNPWHREERGGASRFLPARHRCYFNGIPIPPVPSPTVFNRRFYRQRSAVQLTKMPSSFNYGVGFTTMSEREIFITALSFPL